jgi:hypothetical protein
MNEERTRPASQNARGIGEPCERQMPVPDLIAYFRQYAREKPEVAALWCLGIGFVLGWKLKMW